ncbi:MAG: bifunctional 4-hydroxy-2-oxoglutarate aldolase/2-dehydro-3-deoxy-phosphogluconate aldolase [Corynebacteriales bacterium]|nr:bifunctional 4-hydroxy-2-oxoglutarate aldolase/2-dehydro-3-deoxy-phosphogluconate aldolase [Mycobacteriales bacterium]
MHDEFFAGGFSGLPILAIVQPRSVQQVVAECTAAWDKGIRLVEMAMRGPMAIDMLQAAVAAGRERGMPVGAGTILNKAAMDAVFFAGAAFAVSPGLDLELVRHAQRNNGRYLPGVSTPTEIQLALGAGCRWLKAFPAQSLGPHWFDAMRGPFADAQLVATGGVTTATARALLDSGAAGLGVGGALPEVAELLATGG